jgi:hypothetical protein
VHFYGRTKYLFIKIGMHGFYFDMFLFETSGFWPRVRARALRAPVFFRLINMQNGALRAPPPIAASLLLIYTPKLSLRPELGQSGVRISFHWAKLHPPELHCILLSYAGAP